MVDAHIDVRTNENVFNVLAKNARRRTAGELWTTAFGCGVNAIVLWWQHPSLSWLASGFAAGAAYAIWGLLDRARDEVREDSPDAAAERLLALLLQRLVAVAGTGAALWALLRFMAAALGGWQH